MTLPGDAISGFLAKFSSNGNLGYANITVRDVVMSSVSNSSCIEVIPGDPYSIEIISGNGQTGIVGTQLSLAMVARVIDRFGNPVRIFGISE